MEWLKQQVIAALSGDQKVSRQLLIAVAGVVAVVAVVLVSLNRPETPKGEFAVSEDSTDIVPASIYVHIVGEVNSPGMFQLPIGARLVDAVFAAGGLTQDADNSSINLARELSDGEQIVVFKIGEAAEALEVGGGLVSINRAGDKELEELPGIGPALAGRIIAWREANGGFKSKQDLLKVSGIGEKLLAGLIDQITL